jgi:hypothetical protein
MVLVVFVMALLTLLSVLLIDTTTSEGTRSSQAVRLDSSFQAAEAGIDDYISKLVDDRLYYAHQVHPGEATRRDAGGSTVAGGNAWPYSLVWTYPNGDDHWRQLVNGYEYSLQVTPPTAGELSIRILATGRKVGSTTDMRRIEVLVRPSSLADFQRVVNGNVSWGSTATTNGKLYAAGTIDHDGHAYADMYAENNVTGSVTLHNGAKKYDHTNIRTVIKNPVNFNALLASLVDIQRASQVAGVYLDDPTKAAWRLIFQSNGTFTARSCTLNGGQNPEMAAPICGSTTTYNVPSNGAVYTAQTAVVSGAVNGRVTVGSNDDIVIADNISRVTAGDDVLGLVAKNDVLGATYTPYNLTWYASVIAQSGTWRGATADGSHGTMTWYGSSTTNLGGDWVMFQTRDYSYDPNLLYLPPPWFPVIEDAYTIVLFRELPA